MPAAAPCSRPRSTDTAGNYSLSVPSNTQPVHPRARRRCSRPARRRPGISGPQQHERCDDALYALDGSDREQRHREQHAQSERTDAAGARPATRATRAAAPFAILDTVFRAKELVLTAAPHAAFPALACSGATNNRATGRTVLSRQRRHRHVAATSCSARATRTSAADVNLRDGIYILGDFRGSGDTDEFDQHVIAHEFGHYFEDRFSRSDSIGGDHGGGDRLDLRVAFGEGWGNAFSRHGAATIRSTAIRSQACSQEFGFNLETDDRHGNEGWFSEVLGRRDPLGPVRLRPTRPGDTVALGFAPMFAVDDRRTGDTDALTSIFSFCDGAAQRECRQRPRRSTTCSSGEEISGTDEFGAGETQRRRRSDACCRSTSTIALNHTVARVQPFDRRQRSTPTSSATASSCGSTTDAARAGDDPGDGACQRRRDCGRDGSRHLRAIAEGSIVARRRRAPEPARKRSRSSRCLRAPIIIEVYDFELTATSAAALHDRVDHGQFSTRAHTRGMIRMNRLRHLSVARRAARAGGLRLRSGARDAATPAAAAATAPRQRRSSRADADDADGRAWRAPSATASPAPRSRSATNSRSKPAVGTPIGAARSRSFRAPASMRWTCDRQRHGRRHAGRPADRELRRRRAGKAYTHKVSVLPDRTGSST